MRTIQLFTIGHSKHSLERFLELLRQLKIEALVDIRRFASSRMFPHFNQDHLSRELAANNIEYVWIEALGGRRPKAKNFESPNSGLRNDSFRNYADYMLTDEFRDAMDQLADVAESKRTAIMCAESVFWRCHRKLVSDFVVATGGAVQHIFPSGECRPHALTPEAKMEGETLTYPGPKTLFD